MTRQIISNPTGGFSVIDGDLAVASDLTFAAAHDFVHEGCILCSSGEDHAVPRVRRDLSYP